MDFVVFISENFRDIITFFEKEAHYFIFKVFCKILSFINSIFEVWDLDDAQKVSLNSISLKKLFSGFWFVFSGPWSQ